MKILITSTPGSGHTNPLVPLALGLLARGHHVRWAVAENARESIERTGVATVLAGMSLRERMAAFTDRFGADLAVIPPSERRARAFSAHFGHLSAPRMVADLQRVVEEWTPDLLVHEVAELAGPAIADWVGIPHAALAFSGELPRPALETTVAAVEPVWESLGRSVPADLGLYRYAYFHPFPPSMGQRPSASTVHDLRPSHEDGSTGAVPPSWATERGDRRPLVYVTFGTEMGPIAPWATVMEALASLEGVDVVVTVGPSLDPASLGSTATHVRIERYVPQSWLLPRCRLVVSHAGAGTLLAAAAMAVPQLLIPLGADQFENSSAYLATGAGRSGIGLDALGLTEVIHSLLNDGDHRLAAANLAAEFVHLPGPESSIHRLESLVAT